VLLRGGEGSKKKPSRSKKKEKSKLQKKEKSKIKRKHQKKNLKIQKEGRSQTKEVKIKILPNDHLDSSFTLEEGKRKNGKQKGKNLQVEAVLFPTTT